jgi:hypothetical protein
MLISRWSRPGSASLPRIARLCIVGIALGTTLPLVACASAPKTRVLDPDADDNLGGTGTESGDVRTLAERISRSLLGVNWPDQGAVPRIAVLPLDNQSRFRVDPVLIQNKLVKELVNSAAGRIEFLARDSEQAVLEERAKKRMGMYDEGNSTVAMAGADYLLRGRCGPSAKPRVGKLLITSSIPSSS